MTEPTHILPALSEDRSARWTRSRMVQFLQELAETHSIASAARAVGVSRQAAYRLKARQRGEPFDIAWETALQDGYDALHQAALERALNGVEVPVYHRGELIGTRRAFDERLTVFLLSKGNKHFRGAGFWGERHRSEWVGRLEHLIDKVRRGAPLDEDPDLDEEDCDEK